MITRLRSAVSKHIEKIAKALLKLGLLDPNTVTLLGLSISVFCLVGAYLKSIALVFVAFVTSSAMDVLDGALARASGMVTRFGSVLDSFSDRVEEAIYIMSLDILGIPSTLTYPALTVSFLISYLRALGEKHSIKVEGIGIIERGERMVLLAIAIIGLWIGYTQVAIVTIALLVALGCISVIQRILYIRKSLG